MIKSPTIEFDDSGYWYLTDAGYMSETDTVHVCHVYDAAGNRILWLDGGDSDREAHFDQLRVAGRRLARRCNFGQEMTAVLFRSSQLSRAMFWNPDGTEEGVCGNAIRCAAHFISKESAPIDKISIETPHGIYLSRKLDIDHGSVIMPVHTIRIETKWINGDLLVNVGTPHRIRLVTEEWPEDGVREAIACSKGCDPMNFDLVRKIGPFHFRARIFERGVGETASCGTGAAAIVAALGELGPDSADRERPHLIEFASGEQLNVIYNRSLDSIEICGRVGLLSAFLIPHLNAI
jgi:diaminopimelate epimerase